MATLSSSSASATTITTPSSASSASILSPPDDAVIEIKGQNLPPPGTSSSNSNDAFGTHTMCKDSSHDFTTNSVMRTAAVSMDFDCVAAAAASQQSPRSGIPRSPASNTYEKLNQREFRVSFNEKFEPPSHRRSDIGPDRDGALLCSSNKSFGRIPSLMRSKTKSRLLDPHEELIPDRSHQIPKTAGKSSLASKGSSDTIEEEDPFLEDDFPEDYRKINFNILSIIQLLSLIIIVASLVCNLTIEAWRRKKILQLDLWKWELMVLVLISGRLLSGWAIRIAVFCIERNFLLRKRVLYFVHGLRNAVQNCIWLSMVLIAWQCIFDKKVQRVTKSNILPYVTKIWVCLLVGTLIWLLKTLIVKVLASSFHVSTFFDRIQESLYNQYVIETLSGPALMEMEEVAMEFERLQSAGGSVLPEVMFPKIGRFLGNPRKKKSPKAPTKDLSKEERNSIRIDNLHRLNQKNISAWKMKRLMNIVKKGVFSTLDDEIQGATCEENEALHVHITSENQAKIAAKKIFYNAAKPGSKLVHLEDLMRFMREEEAIKTIRLFEDGSEQKGISKCALRNWMVNAFRERRALALSLNDTKFAVDKLHHMLNFLVGILIIVIWLLILKVATTHFFIFLSSQLLLVVFMFGNTCKTSFEAVIFLFVMHPFDVGDRVEVDEIQMVVEEMNILTTVFLKFDNHKVYYPNSVLSTKPIHNYYRSPDMGDAVDFCIHISTSGEKMASMKERITRYVDNRSDHWYPAPMIVMRDVEDMNRLKFSVWLSHKMNFQDMGERWARRSLLVEEMVKIFRELEIEYRMLPLDINVRNMPPITSTRLPSNWTALSS